MLLILVPLLTIVAYQVAINRSGVSGSWWHIFHLVWNCLLWILIIPLIGSVWLSNTTGPQWPGKVRLAIGFVLYITSTALFLGLAYRRAFLFFVHVFFVGLVCTAAVATAEFFLYLDLWLFPWLPFGGFAGLMWTVVYSYAVIRGIRLHREAVVANGPCCVQCGYSLVGLPSVDGVVTCPECGRCC